jgi:hypothetical protein
MYLTIMNRYIIFVFCIMCASICYGQKFTRQQITQNVLNKWWRMDIRQADIYTVSDKKTIAKYNNYGFILKKDGTYEMILPKGGCLSNNLPQSTGKWLISGDTIIFSAEKNPRQICLKKCDDDKLETY